MSCFFPLECQIFRWLLLCCPTCPNLLILGVDKLKEAELINSQPLATCHWFNDWWLTHTLCTHTFTQQAYLHSRHNIRSQYDCRPNDLHRGSSELLQVKVSQASSDTPPKRPPANCHSPWFCDVRPRRQRGGQSGLRANPPIIPCQSHTITWTPNLYASKHGFVRTD